MRYFRQGYEFTLELSPDSIGQGGLRSLADQFGAAHERLYGFRLSQPVELVNLRVVGTGEVRKIELPRQESVGHDASNAVIDRRQVYFENGWVNTDIYDRSLLQAGNRINGPAIVTQKDSTTVIHVNHYGEVDEYLNILIKSAKG